MAAATYLGTLCKRGHDHEGTGKSLRYVGSGRRSGGCLTCKGLERSSRKLPARWLGSVCKRGHDDGGGSLRNSHGTCLQCHYLTASKWRKKNRAVTRKLKRGWAKRRLLAGVPEDLRVARGLIYDANALLKTNRKKT
jgi:hypothetical protein